MMVKADVGNALPDGERCDDVWAVVVTYNPSPDRLRELLTGLLTQVGRVVVVDNASEFDIAPCMPECLGRIALLRNKQNLGIAAAQNAGIAHAIASATCRFILLLDDDSVPAPKMVQSLRRALEAEQLRGRVAAAGPMPFDIRTGKGTVVILDNWGHRRRYTVSSESQELTDCATAARDVEFLISSGTLIPVAALRALGGLRSNYFIDHVDTEWCFRARAAGFRLVIVPEAHLHHQLGDSVKSIWFLRFRQVAYHAPLRDYYMFRNTFLMLRDVTLPARTKARQLLRLIQFGAYFLTLGDRRMQRLHYMRLGIRHGARGTSGRLQLGTDVCETIPMTSLDPAA